uniref:Uncharacterized protein n=1 Tax=Ditylenchus dipsaci TaxID=166011 RepID=A0A915D6E0_9BILA
METADSNSVVELAKRTIVLYRKSSSPVCSTEQQSSKFLLNWVTKTFNLPINAIQEISNELEIPFQKTYDNNGNTIWKMGFIVLDSSKTHDNIISMFEANIHQMQQCFICKGVSVLLEGRKIVLSTARARDISPCISTPSSADLEDCFRVLSKTTRSNSSSRSTPSSAATPVSAFQSFFPYGGVNSNDNVMAPEVQNLLDAYTTQYSAMHSVQQPTGSNDASITAENVNSTPNDFDLVDSASSTTAALFKHIQKVTENSFWD